MNPANRVLLKVDVPMEEFGETADRVESLMGKRPELRFSFIQENARYVEDLDV